ncbi:creatininase family protein [Neoroseomonas lacus]|uniref:Creatininase family protein n=1 Tax=Neoroseomonas lacus TaxID=287609 RepID=A0A917NPH3_9PROT|nr:creatininase family protein [Neoroseomonas lacus]GGJ15922.1 hypothetical protein GCM10011320_24020 [Neoroseomonas lacus]
MRAEGTAFRRTLLRAVLLAGLVLPMVARAQPVPDSLDIADMTWIEVRDAVASGHRTAIVPSGGIEQNGPHMILGKHDHIVRANALRIARELGDALVVPVLSYSPQGRFDPPEGNLRFPGTIGVTDEAFAAMLEGIARSLRATGFRTICFLADNGPSQRPQERLAARLTAEWRGEGVRVIAVERYYAAIAQQDDWLRAQGETTASIGTHAGIGDTSELMAIHPAGVDLSRLPSRLDTLQSLGATGDPSRASAARGETMLAMRIAAAVAQIRAAQGR